MGVISCVSRRTKSPARASRARFRTLASSRIRRFSTICSWAAIHGCVALSRSAVSTSAQRRVKSVRNRAYCLKLLDLLHLNSVAGAPLGTLPFGMQKRADLARALALQPKLLLLDEPVAGMNVSETRDMAAVILDVKEQLGVTQILVEHDMAMVMGIVDRVLVLDFGRVIALGRPEETQANPDVIKAYLGEELSADTQNLAPLTRPRRAPRRRRAKAIHSAP